MEAKIRSYLNPIPTLIPNPRKCREEALQSFHTVESHFLGVVLGLQVKKREWMLALRAVTSKPLSYFLQQRSVILQEYSPDFGLKDKYE